MLYMNGSCWFMFHCTGGALALIWAWPGALHVWRWGGDAWWYLVFLISRRGLSLLG